MSRGDISSIASITLDAPGQGAGITGFGSILHHSGDYFLCAYRGTDRDGFVSSITIDQAGAIGSSTTNTLEFDTVGAADIWLEHIAGDVYGVFYHEDGLGLGGPARVKTFSVDDVGIISAVIDTFEHDVGNTDELNVVKIADNIWGVCYRDGSSDGQLSIITISDTGVITTPETDTWEFDTTSALEPAIHHVTGTTYVITYRDVSNGMNTLTISAAGSITKSFLDTDTNTIFASLGQIHMLPISGNIYVFGYVGGNTDGFISTITIESDGTIGSVLSTLEYDTNASGEPRLINVDGDLYAIVHSGTDGDGFIRTVTISKAGFISPVLSTVEFDTASATFPRITSVPFSDGVFAILYLGSSASIVKLATVSITTGLPGTIWIEGSDFHYFDESGVERTMTGTAVDNPDGADVKSVMNV